jgi:hypothetical protein
MRGIASPRHGLRFICYCADCQAFARFLERPDVLEPAGGTDIIQMPPARVQLTAGVDALACVCMSAKIFRWYAACCRTPIANTAPRFPIVGMIRAFMDVRDDALGPPLCRLFERSARGPLPADAPPPPTARVFLRRSASLLWWRARGLHRPNPFFDERTGAPRAQPSSRPASR